MKPKAILLSYTGDDLRLGRVLPDAHYIGVAKSILAGQHLVPGFSNYMSRTGNCYLASHKARKLFGGSVVTGWMIHQPKITPGKNVLAGYELISHAVWEKDGEYLETIPAYQELNDFGFLPDNSVIFGSQINLNFMDRESDLKRFKFPTGTFIRPIWLGGNSVKAVASDNSTDSIDMIIDQEMALS